MHKKKIMMQKKSLVQKFWLILTLLMILGSTEWIVLHQAQGLPLANLNQSFRFVPLPNL